MIAHRAGNDPGALRRAEALGADLVEADVRLYRGRPVIRHLKSIGPIPLYWDRWTIASPFSRFTPLSELLTEVAGGTELMLDLKGPRRRLAELVLEELTPYLGERPLTICARWRRLLEPFSDAPVRRLLSVGSERGLRGFLEHPGSTLLDGVSVHERLLTEASVADIRRVTDLLFTWPVNVPSRARALMELGVDGLISDRLSTISPLVAHE